MSDDGCTELPCPQHGERNRARRGQQEAYVQWDEEIVLCKDCGRPEGTFACKIRHIQVNTGWAKSAND